MITQLRIQNFKSWRDTGQMRFAPLTGFFGANSSGKTSILQMLLLMKQSVEARDRAQILFLGEERSYVNLGSYTDFIHSQDDALDLSVHLQWQANLYPWSDAHPDFFSGSSLVSFEAIIAYVNQAITLQQMLFTHGKYRVGMKLGDTDAHALAYDIINQNALVLRDDAINPRLPAPNGLIDFPNELNLYFDDDFVAVSLSGLLSKLLNGVDYLGPLRESPNRNIYLQRGGRIKSVGIRGEFTIPALLVSPFLGYYREDEDAAIVYVAKWLRKLGLVHSFELRPISERRREYEVRIQQTPGAPEVFLTDVGFGVSQILPVLAICYRAEPGAIIILEQPEIHLHPAVQAGLADVFIDVIKNRGVQIILESHSEHLLRRLQRRMAEEQLAQEDVALYFTRMADGESKLDELDIDPYGNIRNWPENFFGDEMGDLVAMTEAAMQRQMRNGAAVGHTQEQ